MNKEWKFEPDPFTRGYINKLDKSPIKFDNLNHQILSLSFYEEAKQNMYSYIRNRLEDTEVKGDYLSENRTNIK